MKNVKMNLDYKGITTKWESKMHEYKVTLKYNGKQYTTSFFTGMGWTEEPTVKDVLNSLFLDSSSYEYCDSLESFMSEFGYEDRKTAKKAYDGCKRTYERLHNMLNSDYDKLERIYCQ